MTSTPNTQSPDSRDPDTRHPTPPIAAIIAAAGRSTRMGEPKQLLPWEGGTVIEAVVRHLAMAGAAPILCVVGHRHAAVRTALCETPAHVIYNPDYSEFEMLRSYQAGIAALRAYETEQSTEPCAGALLALGDQPHIPSAVIRQIVVQATQTPRAPVVPSHNMRRGHPIYLPRPLLDQVTELGADETLRTLMQRHAQQIVYVNVDTDAVLRDMDTPAEYAALKQDAADA